MSLTEEIAIMNLTEEIAKSINIVETISAQINMTADAIPKVTIDTGTFWTGFGIMMVCILATFIILLYCGYRLLY
jgi:hypothetical protein